VDVTTCRILLALLAGACNKTKEASRREKMLGQQKVLVGLSDEVGIDLKTYRCENR
jgi:hypothetical protein